MYSESRQPVFKNVTPREADEFLALNDFPGQRKYNPLKGKMYADNMAAGTHRRIEIAVARIRETGRDILMNGQHNCNAIIISGKPHPACISYYSCDTMEDAWRLFATFDIHASRTERQFMSARRGLFSNSELHDLPLRVLQSCGSALFSLRNGVEPNFNELVLHSKTAKADLVERYSDEVLFVARYSGESNAPMLVIPVVTAIVATRRTNQDGATIFWDAVATGEMLKKTDPRFRLHEFIFGKNSYSGLRGRDRNSKIYSTCICWWNSWRTGIMRHKVQVGAMNSVPKIAS